MSINEWIDEVVITKEQLKKRAQEIGALIDKRHGTDKIMVVGLLKGAYVFTSDVVRSVKNPHLDVEFMVASSYKNGSSIGDVQIRLDLKKPIQGRTVIIIEDIIDTGRTLAKIKQIFINRGAKKVEIAAMCTKPSRREVKVEINYPTFEIPNKIVVGYGLDYNEKFRHLPYVATINTLAFKTFKVD